ncbi:MAG: NAD(P)-binding domain-containing protein [Candidatus Marinimicrobia bacterium]|nr:NAD(P)-binding domain-containing protein [Candidatus Neomarinimicrobiota bacterium]
MNTELIFSWILGAVIIIAFLIPYIKRMMKKEEKARERLKETRSKGQEKALMQHPIINQSACIGCGICVDSCPEGDVLGLINGKATVIHGSHCIGHGKCAEACPLSAIEVGLGDISQRQDIPRLNEHFESNIPGLYVIGELSGLALIRNAIEHGVKAVNHIETSIAENHDNEFDIIIIGAGPSGLTSGLRAKELGLKYLIIDQSEPGGTILQYPRKKLVLVQPVSLPLYGQLKKMEYPKEELLEIWEDVITKEALNLKTKQKLLGIDQKNNGFIIHTNKGDITANKVILGLGRRGTPRKLGVSGEDFGKVMYKLMDAETYKDQKILVAGGGDSAIEAAIGLSHQQGNDVTISYRKSNFFRLKAKNEQRLKEAVSTGKLKVIFDSNLLEITEKEVHIDTQDGQKTILNDFVFIFAGGELPFPLLSAIGIDYGQNITISK